MNEMKRREGGGDEVEKKRETGDLTKGAQDEQATLATRRLSID